MSERTDQTFSCKGCIRSRSTYGRFYDLSVNSIKSPSLYITLLVCCSVPKQFRHYYEFSYIRLYMTTIPSQAYGHQSLAWKQIIFLRLIDQLADCMDSFAFRQWTLPSYTLPVLQSSFSWWGPPRQFTTGITYIRAHTQQPKLRLFNSEYHN